jgi:hypothetical protein
MQNEELRNQRAETGGVKPIGLGSVPSVTLWQKSVELMSKNSNHLQPSQGISNLLKHPRGGGGEGPAAPERGEGESRRTKPSQA